MIVRLGPFTLYENDFEQAKGYKVKIQQVSANETSVEVEPA
jgi:hypothetical protein